MVALLIVAVDAARFEIVVVVPLNVAGVPTVKDPFVGSELYIMFKFDPLPPISKFPSTLTRELPKYTPLEKALLALILSQLSDCPLIASKFFKYKLPVVDFKFPPAVISPLAEIDSNDAVPLIYTS